jgi:hypothetical protein
MARPVRRDGAWKTVKSQAWKIALLMQNPLLTLAPAPP